MWAEVVARCSRWGARPGMVVHIAYGYGLFTGGLGVHQGAERSGCTVVPISGGFDPASGDAVAGSGWAGALLHAMYALNIAEAIASADRPAEARAGVRDLRRRAVDRGNAGRDRAPARHAGARHLRAERRSMGPGVSMECVEDRERPTHLGGSLPPRDDRPETGESLARGEEGELVLHVAHQERFPVCAIARVTSASLARAGVGGRTMVRMSRVKGRHRRHANRPRSERVPERDRASGARAAGARATLPDRALAGGRARSADRTRRDRARSVARARIVARERRVATRRPTARARARIGAAARRGG